MKSAPRASLSVTLLGDEDYRVLMSSRGGAEAFGVFVALLIVARERLQQGQARRLYESNSLIFDNSTTHILKLTNITSRQLAKTLSALSEVARDTGREPWVYLDGSGQLVIRSFFKFNTSTDWGGARPGAGRKSRGNQDDSERNQDDSEKESSRIPSVSVTDSNSALLRTHASAREGPNASPPYPDEPTSFLCIHPGPHPIDPAWAAGFWAKLWAAFGSQRLNNEWYQHQRWYAPAAWEASVRVAVLRGVRPGTVTFLERIAADPKAIEAPNGPPPANGHAPARFDRMADLVAGLESLDDDTEDAADD